jgi:hypothetical protein
MKGNTMEKFDFTTATEPQEKEIKRTRQGHGPCEVHGCPRAGHIYTGGWNCRYHHGKSGSSLARITMVLRNHEQEIDWYEHVLNATGVDFAVGDIAKQAPYGLAVARNETWSEYKMRVMSHVDDLLKPKMEARHDE